ncbi:hypothetical protein C8R44DRAFT_846630 [Mycena epipterygia]|nr:hypothetical protein C8R44DRAFT_846630 [Mycena epipterygia]
MPRDAGARQRKPNTEQIDQTAPSLEGACCRLPNSWGLEITLQQHNAGSEAWGQLVNFLVPKVGYNFHQTSATNGLIFTELDGTQKGVPFHGKIPLACRFMFHLSHRLTLRDYLFNLDTQSMLNGVKRHEIGHPGNSYNPQNSKFKLKIKFRMCQMRVVDEWMSVTGCDNTVPRFRKAQGVAIPSLKFPIIFWDIRNNLINSSIYFVDL